MEVEFSHEGVQGNGTVWTKGSRVDATPAKTSPKTGDAMPIMMLSACAALSAAALLMLREPRGR